MDIEGVEIRVITPNYTGSGKFLFNLYNEIDGFKYKPPVDLLLVDYSHGSRGGNHFHKGKNPNKNPERWIVVAGTLELIAVNWLGQKMNEIIKAEKNAKPLVSIKSDVYHINVPRQSGLVIAEFIMEPFDPNDDTYYGEKAFYEYTSEKYGKGIHVGI